MKHLKLFLLTFFMMALASSAFGQRNFAGKVVDVVDGRTVVIELTGGGKMTAALQYVEVPEPDQQLSAVVRGHLRDLVYGQVVEFRGQGIATGTVITGKLTLGGVDVSQQMLRDGAAWHIPAIVSGQEKDQNAEYAQNQSMAKGQKLGVWSLAGLQPAWEYRAAKEEARRQKELAMKPQPTPEPIVSATPKVRRYTPEEALRANANQELWPDFQRGKRDLNGIAKEYDMAAKFGVYETRGAMLNMTSPKGAQKVECRSMYFYGAENGAHLGKYVLGFLSLSKGNIFSKANNLVVVADGKKFNVGVAKVVAKNTGSGVQEVLFYKLEDEVMQDIAYADKLEVRIGSYTGSVDGELRNSMRNLMLARK